MTKARFEPGDVVRWDEGIQHEVGGHPLVKGDLGVVVSTRLDNNEGYRHEFWIEVRWFKLSKTYSHFDRKYYSGAHLEKLDAN